MHYLIDTGVLLRLLNREADQHEVIRGAIRRLKQEGHECVCTLQNLCEFWNVCTRPQTARGGLGLTFDEALRRLRTLERIVRVLPEDARMTARWKELVVMHRVQGVQVHDTRLVAAMDVWGIEYLVTLNGGDFGRFTQVKAKSPGEILSSAT